MIANHNRMAYSHQQGIPVMTQPAQPQLVRMSPQTARPGFAHHSQNRLGILQIVCGMLVAVVAVTMIFFQSSLYFLGTGIWTGLFYISAGALGVSSARSKSTCPIVGCLIMSIFSMMAAIVGLSFGAFGLALDNNRSCRSEYRDPYGCADTKRLTINISLQTINVLTGLFEFIVALVQMIICSRALCCAPSQPGTIYYAAAPQQIQVQGQYPQQQQPTYPQYQPQQFGQVLPQGQYPQGGYPQAGYPEQHGIQQYPGGAQYQSPQQGAPPMYPQLQQQQQCGDPGRPPPYNPGSASAPSYGDASAYPVKQ